MNRWYRFCFRFHLADGNNPRWWLDLAILDTVVRRVLAEERADLEFWRVHRRSDPRDDTGHQFTFLAYTHEAVAERIDRTMQHSELLHTLEAAQLLREYQLVREGGDDIHLVEGTSDKNWPTEIRRAWPYYIMGASWMLLDLVRQLKRGTETPESSKGIGALEIHYDRIATLMAGMWQKYGSRAYLHQLNALFAYQPLVVRPLDGALITL